MADELDQFFSSKDKKSSKTRSHGKKKGVRPDDIFSKFSSDAAGEQTTVRAEPVPVPKLMQRTQEDDEWKDVEEEKPNEEESDPKKKYEGLRVGMKPLAEEIEAVPSKSNLVTDGVTASPPLGSPSAVPSSEPLTKNKQDVTDSTDSPAITAQVSDLTDLSLSKPSTHIPPVEVSAVPASAQVVPASEPEPTTARPVSPSQSSSRDKPSAPEPSERLPEKASEEAAPSASLPSKSSGGKYVPPAMRRAAAAASGAVSGTGSSTDLAATKSRAGPEEEEREKPSAGGGGGSSYKPPHLRNKERAEATGGGPKEAFKDKDREKEPTSPLKERTAADIMREKFGDKGKENKHDGETPSAPNRLPDIGNQEDFPTLGGPVPSATSTAASGGAAAVAVSAAPVSNRGAWAKMVAPARRVEDELAAGLASHVAVSTVHDAYAHQALQDVLDEHDADEKIIDE